jgi:hypothetical protein
MGGPQQVRLTDVARRGPDHSSIPLRGSEGAVVNGRLERTGTSLLLGVADDHINRGSVLVGGRVDLGFGSSGR